MSLIVRKSHRCLALLCLGTVIAVLAVTAFGQAQAGGDGRVVRVGFFQNYPFTFEKDGKPTGFHLELLREVAAQEGWRLEISHSGSLKNVVQGLEAGALDLGLGLAPASGGQQLLDFSVEKNAQLTGQIFVKAARIDIQCLKDLGGKKVAILNQDGLGQICQEVCARMGVQPQFHLINSNEELAKALATGAVEAALFTALQGKEYERLYQLQATQILFKPVGAQFAVAKGKNGDLIEAIDRTVRHWKKENGARYHELERTFFASQSEARGEWSGQQRWIAAGLCVLLIAMGVNLGIFLVKESENTSVKFIGASLKTIAAFAILIGLIFWVMDSLAAWLLFNDVKDLTLLDYLLVQVPPENLYVRAMFFLICCFFGLFMANYLRRYEELINVLYVSVQRYELLTSNAPDMLYRMTLPQGEYEFVSKASQRILGYSPEEFYRHPHLLDQLVHPDWRANYADERAKIMAGEDPAPWYEFQVVHRAGRRRWVNQRITVYRDDAGVPVAIEGILTDTTELKEGG